MTFYSDPGFQVIEAGANALVAGSAVFGAPDYAAGRMHKVLFLLYLNNFSRSAILIYAVELGTVCSY